MKYQTAKVHNVGTVAFYMPEEEHPMHTLVLVEHPMPYDNDLQVTARAKTAQGVWFKAYLWPEDTSPVKHVELPLVFYILDRVDICILVTQDPAVIRTIQERFGNRVFNGQVIE
jgi:hypothetical protein